MGAAEFRDQPDDNGTIVLPQKVALVLGGGGLKGFAHIGVLRALEERRIEPSVLAGTSIGALIAAAYAGGMPLDEMERRARALRKNDLFRIDHISMVRKRMLSPSLYLARPLRRLVEEIVPQGTFRDLDRTLLINTVDLEEASQVLWGLPGLQDVTVADAVYASCALPGFFPPGVVAGRPCADGGISDNVPAPPRRATTTRLERTLMALRASPMPVSTGTSMCGAIPSQSESGRTPTTRPPVSAAPLADAAITPALRPPFSSTQPFSAMSRPTSRATSSVDSSAMPPPITPTTMRTSDHLRGAV